MRKMLDDLGKMIVEVNRLIDDANNLDYYKMVDTYQYNKIKEALIDLPSIMYTIDLYYSSLKTDYDIGLSFNSVEAEQFTRIQSKYNYVKKRYNEGKNEWSIFKNLHQIKNK